MPELPEVETVKNEIAPHLINRRIKEITLLWDGIIRGTAKEVFLTSVKGKKIKSLDRRGKYLILNLNGPQTLVLHLKMTGSLLVGKEQDVPPQYARAIIFLDDGTAVFFRDPRKFGRMWLVDDVGTITAKLGPEPLTPEFTPELLGNLLAKRKAPLKASLCDQTLLAGIGNLYADEALFLAKIHPQRTGESLTREEINRLHRAIEEVLRAGIKNKGASIVNYYRPDGSKGTAHSEFRVARRKGLPCFVCGTPIERIVIRGRGTYYCPKCQIL